MFVHKEMNDHEFAAHLRKEGAIDNYRVDGHKNTWFNDDQKPVAFAIYDNKNLTRKAFILKAWE